MRTYTMEQYHLERISDLLNTFDEPLLKLTISKYKKLKEQYPDTIADSGLVFSDERVGGSLREWLFWSGEVMMFVPEKNHFVLPSRNY